MEEDFPCVQNFALRKRLEDLTEWERLLFPDLNMILEIRVSQNLAKLGGVGGGVVMLQQTQPR